jgi:hypothetical protein
MCFAAPIVYLVGREPGAFPYRIGAKMKKRVQAALEIFQPHPEAPLGNCAQAIFESFERDPAARPASEREYRRMMRGRAPGGACGAYHAGETILKRVRPDLVREFEQTFRSRAGCTGCRTIRRAGHAGCHDCVLATAEYLDRVLEPGS